MTGISRRAWVLAGLMGAASVAGFALRPASRVAETEAPDLKAMVPSAFGGWTMLDGQAAVIVNPQEQEQLTRLYAQLLMRTYSNGDGYRVMLSIAYGVEQRGALQTHLPEVCYPAQGFEISSVVVHELRTPYGEIPTRRLQTRKATRREPVTYWYLVADQVVPSQIAKRMIEVRLGLQGRVPDGLLFRVSSIDPDTARAYAKHEQFIGALLAALKVEDRRRLSGLGS